VGRSELWVGGGVPEVGVGALDTLGTLDGMELGFGETVGRVEGRDVAEGEKLGDTVTLGGFECGPPFGFFVGNDVTEGEVVTDGTMEGNWVMEGNFEPDGVREGGLEILGIWDKEGSLETVGIVVGGSELWVGPGVAATASGLLVGLEVFDGALVLVGELDGEGLGFGDSVGAAAEGWTDFEGEALGGLDWDCSPVGEPVGTPEGESDIEGGGERVCGTDGATDGEAVGAVLGSLVTVGETEGKSETEGALDPDGIEEGMSDALG